MRFGEHLLVMVIMTCQMVGPIVFLIWVWRRTGRWIWIVLSTFIAIPVVSFAVGGGILALSTAFRVFVLGVGLTGPDIGMNNWQYVGFTFVGCGIYCVGFNGFGLVLFTPLLGGWYLVHRASFTRLLSSKRSARHTTADRAST